MKFLSTIVLVVLCTVMQLQFGYSSVLVVTNFSDAFPLPPAGSLRDQITSANNGDTIIFDRPGTIFLMNSLPITKTLFIYSSGVGQVTLEGSTLPAGNSAINVSSAGTVILSGLVVTNCNATNGAINNAGGDVTVVNSLLTMNTAVSGGAYYTVGGTTNFSSVSVISNNATGFGGAVFNDGGTMNLYNTTFSGNVSAQSGGALLSINLHNTYLEHVTFASNTAGTYGGAIYNSGLSINMMNTLVGTNTATIDDDDIYGMINSMDYNMIQSAPSTNLILMGTVANNIYGLNPLLEPLNDNGYGMASHDLQALSPAIDAALYTGAVLFDQRKAPRSIDGEPNGTILADIGAVEHTPLCVTNTSDNLIPGSLRNVLTMANSQAGNDYICFAIPGAGPHNIVVNSTGLGSLPLIADTVIIDGYTQSLATQSFGNNVADLRITLSYTGASIAVNGLTFMPGSDESVIKGLNISGFPAHGIALDAVDRISINGNHIGTNAAGLIADGNALNGIDVGNGSSNIQIGGANSTLRNVISGNLQAGIELDGVGNTDVIGNYVGVGADGIVAMGNSDYGINIINGSFSNRIGASGYNERNIVADHTSAGIRIQGAATTNNTISGNTIGLDAFKTSFKANGTGIEIDNSPDNVIGGNRSLNQQNFISGNTAYGVFIHGANATSNSVFGNYIGPYGGLAVSAGALQVGVGVDNGASATTIGGIGDRGNLISGNSVGIALTNLTNSNFIYNNTIGLDTSATLKRANGEGVLVVNSTDQIIGADRSTGLANTISGNSTHGIELINGCSGTVIEGNIIGADRNGANANGVGNGGDGIYIGNASSTSVGGINTGEQNIVAFNGGNGINVTNGTDNQFVRNRVFLNDDLGIDLGSDAITANDATDADAGANDLQNYPVMNEPSNCGSQCLISGHLQSESNTSFTVELYQISPAFNDGANGEGPVHLADVAVTTDGTGYGAIAYTHPTNLPTTDYISATATKNAGSTSEYSANALVQPQLVLDTAAKQLDCGSLSGGHAIVFVSQGAGPYNIQWDAAAGNQTADTAFSLAFGTYWVNVTDVNGCMDSTSVTLVPSLVVPTEPTLSNDTSYCLEANPVDMNATYAGQGIFVWYSDPALTQIIGSGPIHSPSTNTVGDQLYYVTVRAGTCEGPPDSIYVGVTDVPAAPIGSGHAFKFCDGEELGAIEVSNTKGGDITWHQLGGHLGILENGEIFRPQVAPATYYAIETLEGCKGPAYIATVELFDATGITVSDRLEVCPGESVTLEAEGGTSYHWTGDNSISDEYSSSPTVKPGASTEYSVTVTDTNNCQYERNVLVDISSDGDCVFHIYTAFSPNDDKTNDTWIIDGIKSAGANWVGVYNRWGDLLIEFNDYNNDDIVWDGKSKMGEKLPPTTYFYVIELKDMGENYNGWVQLTR